MKRLQFFEKDVISWKGKYALHDFYRTLLFLRKTNPALRTGDEAATTIRLKTNTENSVIAYLRKNSNREVFVLLNLSAHSVSCKVEDQQLSGKFSDVFNKSTHEFSNQQSFELKPWDYKVFEK